MPMRYAAALLLLVMAGCAVAPPLPPAAPGATETRRAALQAREAWQIAGRVAVVAQGEGASASLDWRQAGAASDLTLRGPLGSGTLRVFLSGDEVLIEDGEARLVGEDARMLLRARLGAEVPVRQLRYWVLGVPAPDSPFVEASGPGGLPAALDQDGWRIEFDRYRTVGDDLLPARVDLQQGTSRVKLSLSRWEFGP